jgi:small redox-active disulfide protein 2
MKIQVLGSGCPTCKKLNDMTVQAVKELGLKDNVEYLTGDVGTSKIIEMGIMSSPVLVVNDKPVMVGFTPDIEKIKSLIQKAK